MSEIIKQEQGRSMVEMLGVLAVVGVLSVGGIAGYTYAMDKHKSNELLNEASKRAVVVAAQIAAGREPSLREFEDNDTAGGTISTDPATDIDGGVGIKVSGVKESVCKNLVKLENDVMYAAKDGSTKLTESDCSGDSNEFLIVFENMGVGGGSEKPYDVDIKEENWNTTADPGCLEGLGDERLCRCSAYCYQKYGDEDANGDGYSDGDCCWTMTCYGDDEDDIKIPYPGMDCSWYK